MKIRAFQSPDEEAVVGLWHECGLVMPQNNPFRDIERKLQVGRKLFIVGECSGTIMGSCMAGYEGHRGWINYLAVHPNFQGRGHGTLLMRHVEGLLSQAGCPKINLQVRASNAAMISFYERLGYVEDKVVSMGLRLACDS